MNQVIQTIVKHRSIRRFQAKELPPDVEKILLESAVRAPTTAMGHFYSIIEVEEPVLKESLYELCGRQRSMLEGTLFIFAVDLRRSRLWADYLGVGREINGFTALVFGTIDATLAAQNLALAAESLELGTVFIGAVGHKALEVCELLDLPSEVLPIVGLVVGYPAEDPACRPRIPLAFMHHSDRYEDMQPGEIEEAIAAIGNHSSGTRPVNRDEDGKRAFVRSILTGRWWVEGEESLREALCRQLMYPET
jgi:FMN reductase (NADPH)